MITVGASIVTHQRAYCIMIQMAAMQNIAFTFLAVTLLRGGFSMTDEQFKVGFIAL